MNRHVTARIGLREFTVLVFLFTVGSSILIAPSVLTISAKQDAWIAGLLSVSFGAGLAWLYGWLGSMFPEMTPVEYCVKILGKWMGAAAALWYLQFAILLTALVLRNMGDFFITEILPDTPIQYIHLLVFSMVVMAARLGPETIARTAEIFFPWVLLLGGLLILLLLPLIDFHHIQPMWDADMASIFHGSLLMTGTPFMELLIVLSFFPLLSPHTGRTKGFVIGTVLAGLAITAIAVMAIFVLGAELTARQLYPSYILAKKISIGSFLERTEVVLALLWFFTVYFKMTICFYASLQGLSKLFKLQDYRSLTYPLGMIVISYSIIAYPSIPYYLQFVSKVWTPYAMSVGLLLPIVLIITAKFRGLGGAHGNR